MTALWVSRGSFDLQDCKDSNLRALQKRWHGGDGSFNCTAQQFAPLPLGVQQVVDSLALLMATAKQQPKKEWRMWMLLTEGLPSLGASRLKLNIVRDIKV
jgi:hypothetical protein